MPKKKKQQQILFRLSDAEWRIVLAWRQLPPSQQKTCVDLVESLAAVVGQLKKVVKVGGAK